MTKYFLRISILTVLFMALSASSAFAYYENIDPNTTPIPERRGGGPLEPYHYATWECEDCHSPDDGTTTTTVGSRSVPSTWTWDAEAGTNVGSRKGPHGGFTTGTQKCQNCHIVHDAPFGSMALLPRGSTAETCNTCHDGTGGGGVYGVLASRGVTATATHRIESTDLVLGGNTDGTTSTVTFKGPGGTLTCTDCHSPHNANTVAPFLGDRKRSYADTTSATIKTNRLLLQRPTSSTTTATQYGSRWCAGCHQGSHKIGTLMGDHLVADTTATSQWNYNNVNKVTGYGTSDLTTGPLGGDNFGYVMPEARGAQGAPICQQCHEDARTVGDATQFQITSATESFSPSLDGTVSGNPRFQNFPHEASGQAFLIEPYSNLCLNCHQSGSTAWQQTTDAEFATSTLTTITVKGTGTPATVILTPTTYTTSTVFSDGFESGSFVAGGWTNSSWQATTALAAVGTYSAASTASAPATLTKTVDTNGYFNPVLTLRYRSTFSAAPDYLRVRVGSTVTTITQATVSTWTTASVDLPVASSVTFAFEANSDAADERAYVDEVYVQVASPSAYYTEGQMLSPVIAVARPINLWSSLDASVTVPANTTLLFDVLDGSDSSVIYQDITFAQMPFSLSLIDVTAHPTLRLRARFTGNGSVTPSVQNWSVNYIYLP